MKKRVIIFLLAAMPAICFAQSLRYEVEVIKPDSVYLVETFTGAPTDQSPRGQQTTSSVLFRTKKAMADFIGATKSKAEEYRNLSRLMDAKAQMIEAAMKKKDAEWDETQK